MRSTGLEPARSYHKILSLARLPIPPRPLNVDYYIISDEICQTFSRRFSVLFLKAAKRSFDGTNEVFFGVNESYDRLVAGSRDRAAFAGGDDRAVNKIDLGTSAAFDVLTH